MKKLTALFLVFLLLFNIGGYSVVYWMAEHQASREFSAQLDNNEFSGSEAITIKIPISLPYRPNSDFERVYGEFRYNGQQYKLLKQRVLNDTLHVVCVVDQKTTQLNDEMNNFTKETRDASNNPLKVASSSPIQVYANGLETALTPFSTGWTFNITFADQATSLITIFLEKNSPPPWS